MTGTDHFLHGSTRYLPMVPDFLGSDAIEAVYLTGAAEIAGALGLLLPRRLYARLGLPDLRWWAGVCLAVLLSCLVLANLKVALTGGTVEGLDFSRWYYWIRPLFQPVFVVWALYVGDVLGRSVEQS